MLLSLGTYRFCCCPDSAQGTIFFDAERACAGTWVDSGPDKTKRLFESGFSAILIKAASGTLLQSCSAKHNSNSKEQQL